ncbi:hypothetical protein [Ignicoccus hospitalis]|uniref:Uncharacterized protein n=1 Tax=Ignicoccus hospitalis (strain KIN4/I / DSM 18386 / JCM 14125) TaxID=453591 RepID=A8ABW8_IGNH4|nr:hypothetical protein [Ignicoccus hospitalis]ABU82420.1 hypothetical protein Igni_1244 [Ignicoccus hospitalis KIN4/I]HIH90895.1 hypothetical protein [Desulfurococcaceae archaeon]
MNTTLLYVVIANLTAQLPVTDCGAHAISYSLREGSLLATDLTLWLLSSLTNRTLCYRSRGLLPPDYPKRLAGELVEALTARLPKVKNLLELRTYGQWYYVMVSSYPEAKGLEEFLKCLEGREDARALYCFLVLKGTYESLAKGLRPPPAPCAPSNLNMGELYAFKTLARRLHGGNFTKTVNLLYSLYAYALYYDPPLAQLAKSLLRDLVTGRCSPAEAALAALCALKGGRWWEEYALLTLALSG